MSLRAAVLLLLAATAVSARRLPIQVFTSAQGLPRNSVGCLVSGPNGMLWICTSEGLVRFDGTRFRVFGLSEGLPSRRIFDFIPSRKGGFWVVTGAGLCRITAGARIGDRCRPLRVDQPEGEFSSDGLVESAGGETWVATSRALFRVSADGRALERMAFQLRAEEVVNSLAEGPSGDLLVATNQAIYDWRPGSPPRDIAGRGGEQVLLISPDEIWVVGHGFYRILFKRGQPFVENPREPVFQSFETILRRKDRSIWAAGRVDLASPGLWRLETGADGSPRVVETYTQAEGLPPATIYGLSEDAYGNLWGATEGSGIFRIADSGFVSYDGKDGLGTARIGGIFEDPSGRLAVQAPHPQGFGLLLRNGDHFQLSSLRLPPNQKYFGWGWNQITVAAHDGEWWWAAGAALLRFPKTARVEDLAHTTPIAYDVHSPLGCRDVFRAMEDSSGDLWISCLGPNTLTRWERSSGRFHRWSAADGWPEPDTANVIREGPAGTLWIGGNNNAVRFRHGRFEAFPLAPGQMNVVIRDLLIDHAGRVWIATWRAGLFRCDNPGGARPVFRAYTVQEGLSSNAVGSVTEDRAGFIYVGTARGVDRIDPRVPLESRRIRHFTVSDGLPDSEQNVAYCDRQGHVWFGSLHGLSEFDPTKAAPLAPPKVYVTRVRVRGEEFPLPWEGARWLSLNLSANRNQIEIEYAGLDLRAANSLRYQYRLGPDSQWSDPGEQLSVNYATLPRGSLRFEVRAVDADGQVSPQNAGVELFVESPVWLQWWFLVAVAGVLAAVVIWVYNYRVRHLLAIERLRTRIATDLHDDMGASLSQISILSELARKRSAPEVLADIADIARRMAEDMSDIVWAISPKHDRFDGLVHRMRRFADDTLNGRNIALRFETAGVAGHSEVPLEIRRPLYLVFKEAVNNVARHSAASQAVVRLEQDSASLKLAVEDDGRGFDPQLAYEGEGLTSIARRIRDIGGSAHWDSHPGAGTRFTAILPLNSRTSPHKRGARFVGSGS